MTQSRHAHGTTPPDGQASMTAAQMLLIENTEDKGILGWAFLPAVILHLALLLINVPVIYSEPAEAVTKTKIYVMDTSRYAPPPPDPEEKIPDRRETTTPIPDPTPSDPEPIRIGQPEPVEIPIVGDLIIGVPEAPPIAPEGPVYVTGDVERPVKISYPPPRYTEIARKARIQGTVILQAIIDEQGNVENVTVLKGLSMGLTEEAEKAVKQWKFRPAQLSGRPVAVYLNLTVRFHLQ